MRYIQQHSLGEAEKVSGSITRKDSRSYENKSSNENVSKREEDIVLNDNTHSVDSTSSDDMTVMMKIRMNINE